MIEHETRKRGEKQRVMTFEALVVGINRYIEFSDLQYAAADAEAMAQCLEKYTTIQSVKRLPTEKRNQKRVTTEAYYPKKLTSTETLKKAIRGLLHLDSKNPPPNTILFYFSGHGVRYQNQGYLATRDYSPTQNRWGIPISWLAEQLQKSKVKQQIIWLDCCHAGELLNCLPSEDDNHIRCIITSSRDNEYSIEDLKNGHGLLTAALLNALDPTNRQNHPNGFVLSHDLEALILDKFKQDKVKHHPQFFNSETAIILTQAQPQAYIGKSPYRDLKYFTEQPEDAEFYYGREKVTEQLIEKVKKNNFLAVLGTTGSGKSSLMRAGLLYQLKQGQKIPGSNNWKYLGKLKPREEPFNRLKQLLGDDLTLIEAIKNSREERVILVVDQFEECFTMCQCQEQRQKFLSALVEALKNDNNKFCLIIGMRIDYLSNLLDSRTGFATYIAGKNKQVFVTPLQQKELEQAIIQPAKKAGLQVEPGLAVTISNDLLNLPRNLPLLQYVMTKVYQQAEKSKEPRYLTRKMYESLGNVKEILKERADQFYENLNSEDEKLVAKKIFLELTQLDQGRYSHRRIRKQTLINRHHPQQLVDHVIQKLEEAGLITKEHESLPIIEIAHDALIYEWDKLHEWVRENKIFLKLRDEIELAAKSWRHNSLLTSSTSETSDFLWKGNKLYSAQYYLNQYIKLGYLSEDAEEFIQKSTEADEKIKQYREKGIQKLKDAEQKAKTRMWIVIIATIGVCIFGGTTLRAEQKVLTSQQRTQLREKAADIRRFIHINPFEALVRAIAATHSSQNIFGKNKVLLTVQGSLRESIQLASQEEVLVGHESTILSIAVNPEKPDLIATAGSDSKVWIWRRNGYPLVRAHDTQQTNISTIIFARNGDVMTGGIDGSIKVWEINNNDNELEEKKEKGYNHQSSILVIAVNPKTGDIASSDADGRVQLRNLQTGKSDEISLGHKGAVRTLDFSPDGKYLYSAGEDGKVKQWNTETKISSDILSEAKGVIQSVAISPNGIYIASGNQAGEITIRNQNTGKLTTLPTRPESINTLSFSSDNQYLVSGGEDKVVRVWNLTNSELENEFKGHGKTINTVIFSPDNQYIYSGSDDTYLRLWSLEEDPQFGNWWTHDHRVTSVSASENNHIVFGSEDGKVFIWEKKKQEVTPLQTNSNSPVNAVAISQNGELIVSGRQDGKLIVTGKQQSIQENTSTKWEDAAISSVAMTPDGRFIVSGSENGKVRLWTFENHQIKLNKIIQKKDQSAIKSVAISESGNLIAFGNEQGNIKLWNQTTEANQLFKGHKGAVNAVTFSSDGKYLISAGKDKTVQVWDTQKQQQIGNVLRGHRRGVNSVVIIPSSTDELLIASSGEGGTLRLWMWNIKQEKGKHIAQLVQEYKGAINALAIRPDGKEIVSIAGKEIRTWQGETWEKWLEKACELWQGEELEFINKKEGTQIYNRAKSTCEPIWENKNLI
ncbi:MAG: caspase family protein [Microcoleaceae cyanobacterium]